MGLTTALSEIKKFQSKEKAKELKRFFKTGKEEYGEGDIFIGVKVPEIRSVAKRFDYLPKKEVVNILRSEIHEYRLLALLIFIQQFSKGDYITKQKIFKNYIKNIKHINNWDLVDLSAPHIIGGFLYDKDKQLLFDLSVSKNLWKKRIAIVSTFYFIKNMSFDTTLKISKALLNDKEDLIHKAVGWMLREVGKRDRSIEEKFLKKHYKKMPRTMLRYAIERFEEDKRQAYLKGLI